MRIFAVLFAVWWVLSAAAGSYTDFFEAVDRDDGRVVLTLLVRGFDPNTVAPDGSTGLLRALAREPALAVVDALLKSPATNVNAQNARSETALMLAALKGLAPLCGQLIGRGADVNLHGWAPLHYAATAGHTEILRLLLEHHAYIDAESPNGTTPLMMAAMYGSADAAQVLLEAGADAHVRNALGLSAADFARRAQREALAQRIEAASRR